MPFAESVLSHWRCRLLLSSGAARRNRMRHRFPREKANTNRGFRARICGADGARLGRLDAVALPSPVHRDRDHVDRRTRDSGMDQEPTGPEGSGFEAAFGGR
jgi:hypothetical protein